MVGYFEKIFFKATYINKRTSSTKERNNLFMGCFFLFAKENFKKALIVTKTINCRFRNLQSCVAILLLEPNLIENQKIILTIQTKILHSSLFEAFLESAPQLIWQISIILRTGIISKIFSITMSHSENLI